MERPTIQLKPHDVPTILQRKPGHHFAIGIFSNLGPISSEELWRHVAIAHNMPYAATTAVVDDGLTIIFTGFPANLANSEAKL